MSSNKQLDNFYQKIKDNTITKSDVTILLNDLRKSRYIKNKDEIAVCLSLIKNDLRIPKELLSLITLRKSANHGPLVLLTYGHLYHSYPEIKGPYLKMMYKGNYVQRLILSKSLAFIDNQYHDVKNEVIDFFKQERSKMIKEQLKHYLTIDKI